MRAALAAILLIATPAPAQRDFDRNPPPDTVLFDSGSVTLGPNGLGILDLQAKWLTRFPAVKILVEGHTDNRGNRPVNRLIAERRAQAVRDALVARGIAPGRITVRAYGKERPLSIDESPAALARERRVVTSVVED